MATALKPIATTPYQQFRQNLYAESPRGAYWLESMVYGLMAQVDGMTEEVALELACKIVAYPAGTVRAGPPSDKRRENKQR